jgi:phosphoenolpyruvate carboxykinase (GTP)
MRGKTMMVGFYSRGPLGAQGAIPALEITSSAYVIHSADILYRNCFDRFDAEAKRYGLFFTNLHSQGQNRPEDIPNARIYMDRSWLTTYSLYCTYAGNTLLLKKGNHRFAVDIATYLKRGRELSEHMFITGISGPGGRKTYIAGAAPSGCGKTTTAMVGSDFIGDDLAQMWIDENGTCRAVNPEKGIFGIVEDLNRQGDPYLMDCLRGDGAEVIWSNVLVDENGVPQWTGNGEEPPRKGHNYQGEWHQGKTDEKGQPLPLSHPNSRCTLENIHIANYNSQDAEDPSGVQIKIVTYSGRDSDTLPPVWVARNPDHGVVLGASIVSKATATEQGASGVNRQPWANAPFIPGPLADHMDAQFRFFNSRLFTGVGRPIMAGLNYFLTHESRGSDGSGLLGEKRDVKVWLQWLDRYVHGEVAALDTPIGSIPLYKDLKKLFAGIGKDYSRDLYRKQFSLYIDNILRRINLQIEAYQKEEGVTQRLFTVYEEQKEGLERLKEWFGPIVTPEQLESRGEAAPRIPRKVWNLTA